jgi:hypothetical protein
MLDDLPFTRHARDRATARSIPPGVAALILDYGEARDARDGARKYALSKRSFSRIRKDYGPAIAKALAGYRRAYVVVGEEAAVITVAHAAKPLLH